MEKKEAFTVQSAAKAYDVSADIIRAALKRNDLIARYPSSRPVIAAEELKAWFEALPTEAPNQ